MPATVILNIGFAGSGKSTFTGTYCEYLTERKKSVYLFNIDPAVEWLPYEPDLDIRDTVNYKSVMKEYNLGPNAGILTSINLFTTKIDQVAKILEKKVKEYDYIIIDTPGQIETFTWSASGEIILNMLKTVSPYFRVHYIVDTIKCTDPKVFVSSMLYLCSIYYKLGLTQKETRIIFNKCETKQTETLIEGFTNDTEDISMKLRSDSFSTDFFVSIAEVFDILYKEFEHHYISCKTKYNFETLKLS